MQDDNELKLSDNFENECVKNKENLVKELDNVKTKKNDIVQRLKKFEPVLSPTKTIENFDYIDDVQTERPSITVFNVYQNDQNVFEIEEKNKEINDMKQSNFFENGNQKEDYSMYANMDFFDVEDKKSQSSDDSYQSFIIEKQNNETKISSQKNQTKGLFLLDESQFLDIAQQQKAVLQQEIDEYFDKTNSEQINEEFSNLYQKMKDSIGLQLWNEFPSDSLDLENFYDDQQNNDSQFETPQKPKLSLKEQIQQLLKYTQSEQVKQNQENNFKKAEEIQKELNKINQIQAQLIIQITK